MRVTVVGAGIGGLTAALALHRFGLQVSVVERQHAAQLLAPERGHGIAVWGDALRVFDRLGVAPRLRHYGHAITRGEICNAASGATTQIALSGDGDVSEILLVSRSMLKHVLLQALPAETVRYGRALAGIAQSPRTVRAFFQGGGTQDADALLGADGHESAVRAELWGHGPPGQLLLDESPSMSPALTVWRGILPLSDADRAEFPPGLLRNIVGKGQMFLGAAMDADTLSWTALSGASRSVPSFKSFVFINDIMARTTRVREEVCLLESFRFSGGFNPVDLRVRWGHGRLSLLGDAAHPFRSRPNAGAGAWLAIQEAFALASALASVSSDGVSDALRAYEQECMGRASIAAKDSEKIAYSVGQGSGLASSFDSPTLLPAPFAGL